jgi:hypothetical protein
VSDATIDNARLALWLTERVTEYVNDRLTRTSGPVSGSDADGDCGGDDTLICVGNIGVGRAPIRVGDRPSVVLTVGLGKRCGRVGGIVIQPSLTPPEVSVGGIVQPC